MMNTEKAWVINLDRYPENWNSMQAEWSGLFNLHRISAVDALEKRITGRAACKKSHLSLLLRLTMEPDPYHIVMEDDIYRLPEWDTH